MATSDSSPVSAYEFLVDFSKDILSCPLKDRQTIILGWSKHLEAREKTSSALGSSKQIPLSKPIKLHDKKTNANQH
jgi:hypothetical protein